MAGAIQFSIMAAAPCRAFLMPIYRAIHSGAKPYERVYFDDETVDNFRVILSIIKENKGVAPLDLDFDVAIVSDASLSITDGVVTSHAGFYAVSKDASIAFAHFELPQCVKEIAKRTSSGSFKLSSTLCESAGVCIALDTLIQQGMITNKKVLVICDNQGLMTSLNCGRGLAEATNAAMKTLLLTIAPACVTLHGLHLPRTTAIIQIADSLSRASSKELMDAMGGERTVELQADPGRYRL